MYLFFSCVSSQSSAHRIIFEYHFHCYIMPHRAFVVQSFAGTVSSSVYYHSALPPLIHHTPNVDTPSSSSSSTHTHGQSFSQPDIVSTRFACGVSVVVIVRVHQSCQKRLRRGVVTAARTTITTTTAFAHHRAPSSRFTASPWPNRERGYACHSSVFRRTATAPKAHKPTQTKLCRPRQTVRVASV